MAGHFNYYLNFWRKKNYFDLILHFGFELELTSGALPVPTEASTFSFSLVNDRFALQHLNVK